MCVRNDLEDSAVLIYVIGSGGLAGLGLSMIGLLGVALDYQSSGAGLNLKLTVD